MNIPKLGYSEGSILVNGKGVRFECTHFDSKDTCLKNLETGKTKFAKSMTAHRYYEVERRI